MSSSKNIEHKGVIEEVADDLVRVNIVSTSACSSCHAKGVCGAADVQNKTLEIKTKNRFFSPGEQVNVILKQSEGYKALMLGYVFPLFIILLTLFVSIGITGQEGKSGLISLFSILIYYLTLYFNRKRLQEGFHFIIRKTN